MAAKAACIAELQETIAARDAAHEAAIAEKDARIAALQAAMVEKDVRIAALQAELGDRPTRAAYDALATDLAQVRELMRATLALPRYRVADRLNSFLRWTGPLHAWMRKATARALKGD